MLVAGFLPLPAPSMTAPEVAAPIYAHTLRIQFGMVPPAVGAAFLGPFVAELTVQMRRIEGEHSPLNTGRRGPRWSPRPPNAGWTR